MTFLGVQRNRLLTLAGSSKGDILSYEGHVWAKIKGIKLRLGQHGKEMTEIVQEVLIS
jgi:hypothetical protein